MAKLIGDRISVEDDQNKTTIVIYPVRNKLKEFLLTFWVLGFTFVGLVMVYLLMFGLEDVAIKAEDIQDAREKQRVYLAVFISFWLFFEYKIVKALLWYKFGKELLSIDEVALSIKKSTFKYGKSNRYFFENIKKFSLIEQKTTSFNHFFENSYWSIGTDSMDFEYFGKVKPFGRRLDEKTAKILLKLIDDRVKKRLRGRTKLS